MKIYVVTVTYLPVNIAVTSIVTEDFALAVDHVESKLNCDNSADTIVSVSVWENGKNTGAADGMSFLADNERVVYILEKSNRSGAFIIGESEVLAASTNKELIARAIEGNNSEGYYLSILVANGYHKFPMTIEQFLSSTGGRE